MEWPDAYEEFYKLMKGHYLGQGQLHARTPLGVEQEIHATALFVAITRFLMAAAAESHQAPYQSLSPKSGALGVAAYVVRLLLACSADHAAGFLDQLLLRSIRTRDP